MIIPRVLVATILALAPAWPLVANAADSLEELVIKSASTPEEHAGVSDYFRSRADAAAKEAERHRAMAKAYTGTKLSERQRMHDHCGQIAASHDALAKQYRDLAAMHDAAAKQP